MKKEKRIVVIGNFGYKTNQLDGQTVKTRSVLELLTESGFSDVKTIDTSVKVNSFKITSILLRKHIIIYVGAKNSFALLFPFVWFFSKLNKSCLHYNHVGSFLTQFLKNKPIFRRMLNTIDGNYAQTKMLCSELESLGIKKVDYLPNFRISGFMPKFKPTKNPLKLVYLGRILKEKGIDLLLDASKDLKEELNQNLLTIDFYGQLVDERKNYQREIEGINGFEYKGFLEPDQIHETLSKYDAMVFPTYFYQEGFPGTILDAFIAGIPTIASDWLYNSELVEHNSDGLIFKSESVIELVSSIRIAIQNPELINDLKKGALLKGKQLHYRNSTTTFIEKIKKSLA